MYNCFKLFDLVIHLIVLMFLLFYQFSFTCTIYFSLFIISMPTVSWASPGISGAPLWVNYRDRRLRLCGTILSSAGDFGKVQYSCLFGFALKYESIDADIRLNKVSFNTVYRFRYHDLFWKTQSPYLHPNGPIFGRQTLYSMDDGTIWVVLFFLLTLKKTVAVHKDKYHL